MGNTGVMLTGSFPDLCVRDVSTSTRFYRALLGLDVIVDLGWYVELGVGSTVLLALVETGHETVPSGAGGPPRGLLVSFETDDVEVLIDRAIAIGVTFVLEPARELGQYHFMVTDPDGAIVDVIQRVPFEQADRRRLVAYRRAYGSRTPT